MQVRALAETRPTGVLLSDLAFMMCDSALELLLSPSRGSSVVLREASAVIRAAGGTLLLRLAAEAGLLDRVAREMMVAAKARSWGGGEPERAVHLREVAASLAMIVRGGGAIAEVAAGSTAWMEMCRVMCG